MTDLTGKQILITGINGFIGSHLARTLIKEGATVHGTSRHPHETPYLDSFEIKNKLQLHTLDVRKAQDVESLLRAHSFDGIFHLASQADAWKSSNEPHSTFDVNVQGTANLLEAIRKSNQSPSIVLASSVRVFHREEEKLNEEHLSLHPYDASKLEAEVTATSYFNTYGMNGAIARNTNTYGENDLNFNRLLPRLMKGIFHDGKVTLWGNGTVKRDFMHVSDTVTGMRALYTALSHTHMRGKSFTFASGKLHTIREIVTILSQCSTKLFQVEWDEHNTLQDRNQAALDIQETTRALNWSPRVELTQGLDQTLKWYRAYFTQQGRNDA